MSQVGQDHHYKQRREDRYNSREREKKSKKEKKHKQDRYHRSVSHENSHDKRKDQKHHEKQVERSRSKEHKKKNRHQKEDRYRDNDRDSREKNSSYRDRKRNDSRDRRRSDSYERRRDRGDKNRERDRNDRDRVRDDRDRRDRDDRDRRDRDRGERGDRGDRGGDRDRNRGQRRQRVEKDPYFEQRRQIERIRLTDPKKAEEMQKELDKKIIFEQKEKQVVRMKQKFKEAQKEMEEAKRQDHTIIVYCLPLKAKEKHIWKFFYDGACGKVRDIRIIRDARSGRSKGVAYVQFYTSQSVQRALLMAQKPFELKGRYFTSLKVQHSQAEKNRAAAAAKQLKLTKPIDPIQQAQQTQKRQMKVMVGGLNQKLADIQESQLKELFQPFGPINYVDIHRDPMTGKCKGFAFIQYMSTDDAKNAVREMNNLKIGQQRITVQTVNTAQKNNVTAGQQYLYSSGNKAALMNKLSRDAPSHSNLMRPPISTSCTPYLVLSNLFKMEGSTPKFFEDLKKQVQAKCSNYGIVEKCFIEKNNQGNVWVKFSDTQSAIKGQQSLNGQYFDGVKVFCYFVTQSVYQSRVGI